MAGPGIRAWHFARELAPTCEVTLVAQHREPLAIDGVRQVEWASPDARAAFREADVLVGQPHREILRVRHRRTIFDLFDPKVLELDELIRSRPTARLRLHRSLEWGRLGMALSRGWRLIAATGRQRDFYLGMHASRGGLTDGWADRWLEIPFGAEPSDGGADAIDRSVPVIVWGGGAWEWLDPELAVRAVERVRADGLEARLLFLGSGHPNAELPGVEERTRSGDPSAIVRNDGWIPWTERGRWLRPCRAAIMLHRPTAEAEMSIRTRLFDAIAFGLPLIATRGGWSADLVEDHGLGLVVDPGSVESVAMAIRRLVEDDALHASCVRNLESLRPRFAWRDVVRPLAEAVASAEGR